MLLETPGRQKCGMGEVEEAKKTTANFLGMLG